MRSYFTSQKMKTQGLEDSHYLRFPFGRFFFLLILNNFFPQWHRADVS